MPHCIALLCTQLLRLLLPPHGRHRAAPNPALDQPETPRATTHRGLPVTHQPPQHPRFPLLRGEDSPLVRPYVLSGDELRHKKRQQRQGRRALRLATHGIDTGPRRIHGVEVAA
ncbi:hypothetical protein AB0I77_35360 [Streptomyces sp. NPDC050619]|uniref:hypothetical protein n=1 Tax=Streptomyces sp. NPDC050619 TaxID=3157214 RepID=UPI00342B368B